MSGERLHNMKAVEMRTGLSAHLIRVWERRYAAVTPSRSEGQQRLYTEAEIEKLDLLRRLSHSGLAISQIARLSTEQLRILDARTVLPVTAPAQLPKVPNPPPPAPTTLIPDALTAIKSYDMAALEALLDQAMLYLGYSGMLEKFLIPLLHRVGAEWEAGQLTAAQEHGATALLKDYLARNVQSMQPSSTAPHLIVTTPAGQLHEMGASIAAGLARKSGWRVTYLGPSLPAEEIASAAIQNQAHAVALSILYPADDPGLPHQLTRLRHLLPHTIPLLIGGQAVAGYRATLEEIGAHVISTMGGFTIALDEVRAGRRPGSTPAPPEP